MGKFDNVKTISTAQSGQPTGKFANVKTVTSTPQAVQETPQKEDNFLQGIIRHPAEVGVSAYNLAKSFKDMVRGETQQAGQDISATRTLPFLGETKPAFTGQETTGELLKKQLGYGAELASFYTPASVGGAVASTAAKTVPKLGMAGFKEAAVQGFKQSIPLIPSGIAGGAGYSAVEGGSPTDIVTSGLIGGAATPFVGGAAGVVGHAVAPAVRGVLSKFGNKEAQAAERGIVQQKAEGFMAQASDVAAKNQKAKVLQKTERELYQNLTDEQIPLGTQKGTDVPMVDATVAEPVLQAKYKAVDDALDSHLAARPQQDLSLREIELSFLAITLAKACVFI